MVANRKHDGENEYVTLEHIEPVFAGKNHLHADMWVGVGTFDEKPMRLVIRNTREVRALFLAAGYVPANIFCNVVTSIQITVLTTWDAGYGLQVAEVLPSAETVHTEAERKAAWAADMAKYGGKFDRVGVTELRFSRLGESVTWGKDTAGRYVRTEGASIVVFEAAIHPDIARLEAALKAAGITPAKPLVLVQSGAVKRTRTGAVSIGFTLPKDTRLPAEVWAIVEDGFWRDGDWYVVQLKSA